VEIAHRYDGSQGLQGIYYNIFPMESEQLIVTIILTFQKALIRSIMSYACPARQFAADNHSI
jgi:hypothetical protein